MSYTCGTGGWSGPLPGDPSTNSILTATPVFGGIDVTWTPAIVNPHAVAHTYLYRSTNPDFLTAVPIATVGGTHFYDKLENLLTYYYWIQIVSINGTLGEVIGPASAIPRLSIDATIEALTGRIDNGVLAQSLKSEIDRISLIDGDLFQEIQDRIAANELLGAAIQSAQTDASQAVSMLNEEITQRTTAYNVLLQTLNTMAGQVNDNKAAIETETTLRISNDEALAQQITNVQSAAEDNLAAVQTTLQTNINTVNGKVTDIGALYTAKVQVNGLIGGFGVYNDGTEVQAGFDVDTFWVGRTGPDKKKPFIIDSTTGETYIDKAVIPTLTADMIDTRGLSIKDTNGNIILAAGTALDWSRIGGVNKPEDGATVGADWYNNVTNRPEPTSFLETFESGNLAQWTNYNGTGELSVVSASDSLTGGKVLRIGNNSGNDQAWLIHKQNIPFDPSALYRIKFRVRRTAGTGMVWLGVAGVAADGVTFVNIVGANDPSNQHYVAASNQNPGSAWTEYVGYFKGTAAFGQTSTNPSITAPLKLHQSVKYIRPLILANHQDATGTTEVDYCSIELMTDTMNWDGVSGTGKDALVTTASTALTNANAAQAAANTANNTLADIASDNKLTPVEKQSAANEWGIINRERASIQAQASALGISSELGDYNYTYAVLNDYITPLLADLQNPSAIDGPTFRDKWSYFYEYRQRLMNKMSAVAATKADWASVTGSGKPENGATVGANSNNLKTGVGVNMVFNGDYTDGLAGTTLGWRSAGNQHILSRNLSYYIVQGEGTAYIHQPGWNGTALFEAYIWNGQEGQYFAVTPGQRYEVYAYLNTHRCVGRALVLFLDAAGNQITEAHGSEVGYAGSINTISDMVLSHGFVVAPWNAAKALVIVRGYGIDSYDPYVFFSRVYFGMAHAGQTEASPWSPGRGISQITTSNVTTYIANAAIGNAQIGGNLWSTNWNYAGGTGWLLDRSGNFYGNNIYARGDIEASSLKANTAMVQTLNIAGDAVSVSAAAYNSAGSTTSVVLDSGGARVNIFVFGAYRTLGYDIYLDVLVDGVQISTSRVFAGNLQSIGDSYAQGMGVYSINHIPPSGNVTYGVRLRGVRNPYNSGMGTDFSILNSGIQIISIKR